MLPLVAAISRRDYVKTTRYAHLPLHGEFPVDDMKPGFVPQFVTINNSSAAESIPNAPGTIA
jgi:hypothetical protein